jgi:iron(III) transport system ATP-binding protein
MAKILEASNLSKAYNGKRVIDDFSFVLEKGSIGCLLGESGCGKTTVLRLIAGFERLQAGRIIINGQPMSMPGYVVPPRDRHLGMVFQDYALFPHLSVRKNIAFGIHHYPSSEKQKRVRDVLDLVGLSDAAEKYPHELSGGQQQRVALARALAPEPDLLLMDEPFSNLDVALRERLSVEVGGILKGLGISALLVTHNQNEAFAMADVIGVMNKGRLEQLDTAYNLYHRPKNQYVADFVGEGILISGIVESDDQVATQLGTLKGHLSYPCCNGCAANVLIRPEDIIFDDDSPLKAEILRKDFRGANILYTLRLPGISKLLALVSSHHDHTMGQKIGIRPKVEDIILFETVS